MTLWTRSSAIALAAVLLAGPAVAADDASQSGASSGPIHEDKDAQGRFDQPYVPGYNQSPDADVVGKGPPTIDSEEQQANRLSDEPALPEDKAAWENRGNYTKAAGEAVDFWKGKVADLDTETVRLDDIREQLSSLEESHGKLQDSETDTWQANRDAFQEDLMGLREEYAELPQQRKSSVSDSGPETAEGATGGATTD